MSTIKPPPDPFARLKAALDAALRDYNFDFLASYVSERELHRDEEDTFIRLGLANLRFGGVSGSAHIDSYRSQVYDLLDPEQRIEMRRWWHEMVRREAEAFADLNSRLAMLT